MLLETAPNFNAEACFFVTTASMELARISRIVKQSLTYYRVGTISRDLDLGGIVNESLQIFGEKLQRSGIELNARIDKGGTGRLSRRASPSNRQLAAQCAGGHAAWRSFEHFRA